MSSVKVGRYVPEPPISEPLTVSEGRIASLFRTDIMKRRAQDLLGEGGTVVGKGAVVLVHEIRRCCVGLCQIRGGKTENNNRVKLHKYQIWASAGRIIDKPACSLQAATTWCAFSPQTGVNYHRTDTEKNRGGRLADTHNSFALQSHPFCKAAFSLSTTTSFSSYIPKTYRLLLSYSGLRPAL